MAQVIAKLFQNRKFQGCCSSQSKSNTKWHVARFTKEDINLVLFKEHCDKQILDSRSFRRVTLEDLLCEKCIKLKRNYRRSGICKGRCSKCPGLGGNTSGLPKFKKVSSGNKNDKLVREMIFGACPLASAETTIKVHSLKSPHKLMLSCVFQFKKCRDDDKNTNFESLDSFESEIFGDGLPRRSSENNLASMSSHSSSCPMDIIPQNQREGYWGSDSTLNLSVSSSSYIPPSSPGAHSTASISSGSRLAIMRRMRHSFNRSLQYNNLQSEQPSSLPSSSGESDRGVPVRRRGARLGMAVMFNLDEFDDSRRNFEAFFFSHITIIEGHMLTLRTAIEQSPCEANFEEFIMEALEDFRQKVYDLYTTRPLERPVWLSLMASQSQRYRLCEVFVREFSLLIDRYDTKSTNYFVSSLLTGVLMYHLAWVPTVTPSGETQASYADKHSPKWPDMLAKTHPYNPLWAQLSDMYGAIGMPPRLARTIVTGKKVETIIKFLTVLSYFIRCSEIHETLDECYDEENLLCQIQSAVTEVGDLCLDSIEKDGAQSDFVLVDAPDDNLDMDLVSDSGLVSEYTSHSKATRPRTIGINNTTLSGGSESGFTEPDKGAFAAVKRVPSSSPADKVQDWLNASQLNEGACISEPQLLLSNPHTELTRSTTDSTLVNTLDSPCLSPMSSSHVIPCASPCAGVRCAPDPIETRCETVALAGRAAISPVPELTDSQCSRDMMKSSSDSGKSVKALKRKDLVRLFSSEIDDMDYVFDGKPPALSRQVSGLSSTSQFDELFEGDDLDSFSAIAAQNQAQLKGGEVPEIPTPTNGRNMLNKVMKQAGFSHQSQSPNEASESNTRPPLTRENSVTSQPPSTTEEVQESCRPRNLSVGKASSRCSTPQTLKGGDATPASDPRTRHLSLCPTILSDHEEDSEDPFNSYEDLDMPRSTNVSKLADPAISTTNFGRQMLAGFSDHYLSDFVLHGTSDEDVHRKVQKDLVASEAHSVLEDRINEAVCVVADTERWCINVCSSKREQPKPLAASDLVKSMVEATNTLAKLKMSPELILIHMEDRLQEMFFKSRMLSEYIKNQKSVDMDELNAMFGLAVTDIRFLLSVASTHSTVNVHGIY